ncbi:MAG: GrpB family protein [Proteobacteria bacterium]|nr:GrpB family protein [Pseudomonadota bacterium]
MNGIKITEYQSDWSDQFANLASVIRSAIGTEAVRIDHIGSTSVPDLAAKDILDVQITVSDLNQKSYLTKLQDAGFRLREHIVYDLLTGLKEGSIELRKRFLREIPGQRQAHIHVREQGRLNQIYPLLFRDYLKADAVVRAAYEVIKKELAEHFPDDADAYYRIKDPCMDTIYQGAKLWAEQCDWEPDDNFQ